MKVTSLNPSCFWHIFSPVGYTILLHEEFVSSSCSSCLLHLDMQLGSRFGFRTKGINYPGNARGAMQSAGHMCCALATIHEYQASGRLQIIHKFKSLDIIKRQHGRANVIALPKS